MPRSYRSLVIMMCFAILFPLASCGGRGSLEPGQGEIFKVEGFTYEQVWVAVVRAVSKGFNLDLMNKKEGVVTASLPKVTSGERVAVYIRPAEQPSPIYVVEVVSAQRDIYGRDWQKRIAGDIIKMLPHSQKKVRKP